VVRAFYSRIATVSAEGRIRVFAIRRLAATCFVCSSSCRGDNLQWTSRELVHPGGMVRSAKVHGKPGCSVIKAASSTLCALYAFNHAIMLINRSRYS
jgi:hypothetical protein